MPTPNPDSETKSEFMSRCVPIVIADGTAADGEQGAAICSSMWDEAMKERNMSATEAIDSQRMETNSVVEVRARGRKLVGYAAKFNRDTTINELGMEFTESIAPTAFSKSLRSQSDILAVMDHDLSKLLGRTKSKTLRLEEDAIGLKFEIDVPNTQLGNDALTLADRGDLGGMSFRFGVPKGGDVWSKDMKRRQLVDVILKEISVVSSWPAYKDTEVFARSEQSRDLDKRALSGMKRSAVVDLKPVPPVGGITKRQNMTRKEHIAALEAKRAANDAAMEAIRQKAETDGRTLDEVESENFDTLQNEIDSIDKDLARFRAAEERSKATAVAIPAAAGTDPVAGAAARVHTPITVKPNVAPGIGFARAAICMYNARNIPHIAAELARQHYPNQPEVEQFLRANVNAADTQTSGWASQLVPAAQQLSGEFIDMLRPATIIGRIPGIRRVPFNVAVPIRTAGGTARWVGEGVAKPVTSETFTSKSLTWAKCAMITVITQELARFSAPAAEALIRDSMVKTLVAFYDAHFVSATAAVANESPAGILNGISAVIGAPSGTTGAAFRTDFGNLLDNMTANNINPSDIAILMSASQAVRLSLIVTDLGVALFPNITQNGGTILGFPVVVSEAVGAKIIAVKADDILLAEDPGVSVSVSDQATIEMDSTPAQGAQSPVTTISTLKSMFQNNMIAIRTEQFITWAVARAAAVEWISGNAYVP